MPTQFLGLAEIKQYNEEGYVILRGAFSPARIRAMVEGYHRLLDRALMGLTEVGWIDKAKRIPARTSSLLHPVRYDASWAEWLDEDLIPLIEPMAGGPARHSLFGMLNGGGGQPYLQGWHRDLGKPGAPDEVEYLKKHHGRFVQFNAPLLNGDQYLHIVPGSHLRASTKEEIAASKFNHLPEHKDPNTYATPDEVKLVLERDEGVMPGAMVVKMNAGDIAFYNANLWHRGWNPHGGVRWTMHSAFWLQRYEVMAHEHGQREAMTSAGHMDRMPPGTRAYIQRYLDAYPTGQPRSLLDV
jgi:hypothetical protein